MKALISAFVLSILFACATPYQRIGTTVAGGYSSTRVATNQFDVRFLGNGFTEPRRAYDFALLRASEVALEHNYPYFVLLGQQDQSKSEIVRGNSTSYTTGTLNTQGGFGSFNGTTTTYNNDIPVMKPGTALRIYCMESRDELGPHAGNVYDAQQVRSQLRSKYQLDQ